jgi:hypothetical protein
LAVITARGTRRSMTPLTLFRPLVLCRVVISYPRNFAALARRS